MITLTKKDGLINFEEFGIDFSTIKLISKKRWYGEFSIRIVYLDNHYEILNFRKNFDRRNEIFDLIKDNPDAGDKVEIPVILWNDYFIYGEYMGD